MWFTHDLKCLISPFPPSNVNIIDSYFYMLFWNAYYITICRLYEKHSIPSEVKNWQVCYLIVVTLAMAHYIANLPIEVSVQLTNVLTQAVDVLV
jgi:uncharacterized membrane protein YbaN (DUF454 family)